MVIVQCLGKVALILTLGLTVGVVQTLRVDRAEHVRIIPVSFPAVLVRVLVILVG